MKFVRDYYLVQLPGDCADSLDIAAQLAIVEARERARLYCLPCEWQVTHLSGEPGDSEVVFRVRRKRQAKESRT
jgi:hypothetical protein